MALCCDNNFKRSWRPLHSRAAFPRLSLPVRNLNLRDRGRHPGWAGSSPPQLSYWGQGHWFTPSSETATAKRTCLHFRHWRQRSPWLLTPLEASPVSPRTPPGIPSEVGTFLKQHRPAQKRRGASAPRRIRPRPPLALSGGFRSQRGLLRSGTQTPSPTDLDSAPRSLP